MLNILIFSVVLEEQWKVGLSSTLLHYLNWLHFSFAHQCKTFLWLFSVLFCMFLLLYGWFQHKTGEIMSSFYVYVSGNHTPLKQEER
jgi:hypothetical protein